VKEEVLRRKMAAARVRSILMLFLFLGLSLSAALFGAQFQPGEWYEQLSKPSWTPPNWLFAPVWTFLYFAMAVAAWLVWRRVGWREARLAFSFFVLQLMLNAIWSWVFFALHRPGLAFGEITVLWAAVLTTLVMFWRRCPLSGALFLPYLVWVSFAAVLNFSLWRLNL
jgi:tryptophan-rich sensory protein